MEEEKKQEQAAPRPPKKRRGFAVMDPRKVSEIASKGGKAAHEQGTAHVWSKEEAAEAGRKGGHAAYAAKRARAQAAKTE